jgi:ketosteroid isomerase-like protein
MENVTNKAITIRFVKAINDHDVDEISNLMSEDHLFIDASGNKSVGKKGMKDGWKAYYELFPDYQIEVTDIIENASFTGLFGYVSATYKNLTNKSNSNFWRIPAAWKAIVENKKIKQWQVYCDYSNLLKIIEKNK